MFPKEAAYPTDEAHQCQIAVTVKPETREFSAPTIESEGRGVARNQKSTSK
jgi:hypothetical protein